MSLLATLKSIFGFTSTPKAKPGDRLLTCLDCQKSFVFDEGEQRFFKSKGFTDPKRCPHCRKQVRSDMKKKFRGRRPPRRDHHRRGNSLVDGDSPYADER